MKLTAARLKKMGACSTEKFEEVFPDGAYLTVASLKRARVADLNVDWLRQQARGDTNAICRPGICRSCDRLRIAETNFQRSKLCARLAKLFRKVPT